MYNGNMYTIMNFYKNSEMKIVYGFNGAIQSVSDEASVEGMMAS